METRRLLKVVAKIKKELISIISSVIVGSLLAVLGFEGSNQGEHSVVVIIFAGACLLIAIVILLFTIRKLHVLEKERELTQTLTAKLAQDLIRVSRALSEAHEAISSKRFGDIADVLPRIMYLLQEVRGRTEQASREGRLALDSETSQLLNSQAHAAYRLAVGLRDTRTPSEFSDLVEKLRQTILELRDGISERIRA